MINAFLHFLLYFSTSIILLVVFMFLYLKITPHNDVKRIKKGEISSALVLSGAMLGFIFPLLASSFAGISFVDFVVWACISGSIQMISFRLLSMIFPEHIKENNVAASLLFFVIAIILGLFNAFSLLP